MRRARRALSRSFLIHAAAAFVALSAARATAAPSIAVHPLIVVGGEGDETSPYASLLDTALARHGIHPLHPDRVRSFLAKPDTDDCQSNSCLGELARAASAQRALLVSISPYTPRLIVSARLVSASGVEIDSIARRDYIKGGRPLTQVILEALDDFIGGIPFDAPEPRAPVATTPVAPATSDASSHSAAAVSPTAAPHPVHAEAALAPKPQAADLSAPATVSPHPTLRLASYLAAGAGALALIGATTVSLASRSDRARLEQMLDANGNRPPSPEAQSLDQSLASRSRLTNILLAGGGLALASGAAMFWLSRPSSAPTVAVAAGPGGAAASVQGHF